MYTRHTAEYQVFQVDWCCCFLVFFAAACLLLTWRSCRCLSQCNIDTVSNSVYDNTPSCLSISHSSNSKQQPWNDVWQPPANKVLNVVQRR
jgi:hypothetical protein